MAEACQILNWNPDEALRSPAHRFFALLKAGRDTEYRRQNWLLMNLCDVVGTSGWAAHKENSAMIRQRYFLKWIGEEEKISKTVFNATDPDTGKLVAALFGPAARGAKG